MTVFLSAHFDSATSGTLNATTEPGISSTSNTDPTYSGVDARYGAAAALIPLGLSSLMLQNLPTQSGSLYWRVYFKMKSVNSSLVTIAAARDSASANCASIAVNAAGSIVLRDGNTGISTTSYSMNPSNSWVRLEWFVNRSGNTQTLSVFYGANIEGTVANETLTATCSAGLSLLNRIVFGAVGSTTGAQFAYDEAVLADAYVGAFASASYTVTVWSGSSELPTSSVTVWDGTAEVPASLAGVQP